MVVRRLQPCRGKRTPACRAGVVRQLAVGFDVMVAARSHEGNVSDFIFFEPWNSHHRPTPCGSLRSRTAHRRQAHRGS